MSSTSSFGAIDAPEPGLPTGWRPVMAGALNAAASNIPLSLGCATLIFIKVGPELIANGVFATMLALVLIHLVTSGSRRPLLYSARFFEATTIAAMMDQVVSQLSTWGLPDTSGVRLAFLCLIGAGAGVTVGLLYLLRAHRLTPLIPAPVFSGFSNSIALALLISQSATLWQLLSAAPQAAVVVSIALVSLAAAIAPRRWLPQWPSAAVALLVGLVGSALWLFLGQATPMVGSVALSMSLPVLQADFGSLASPQVKTWPVLVAVAGNAAILGTMMFINTTMSAQMVTRMDGQRATGGKDSLLTAICLALTGFGGSAPISGGNLASISASRVTRLSSVVVVLTALIVAAVYFSGMLAWIPLAAVCAALLCEGWFLFDRASIRMGANWLRRRAMSANEREDLALIAAVTACAVLLNMVAAVFAGLLLGLVLFAVRNAKQPIGRVWTGSQLSSNSARSRTHLALLAERGSTIKVFELQGDLFFGVAESLEQSLRGGLEGASCAVIDWSRVRHIDSSLALSVSKFEHHARGQQILPIHAGSDMQGGNVASELLRHVPDACFEPDLDHALEHAENELLRRHGDELSSEGTTTLDAPSLFLGLNAEQRQRLDESMPHRFYAEGAVIVAAGDPSDELMLMMHGSASILVHSSEGRATRLAGARRGATLGEIGFLDGSPRSATIVAEEDVTVAILARANYDALCRSDPQIVQRLLANIALDLATRLRHTNRLALARQTQR